MTLSHELRILLVEDNPVDQKIAAHHLEQALPKSHALTTVGSLADALKALKTQPVDVVLLDLGLPDGWGVSSVTCLRSAAANVPIVVLSGSTEESLASEAVRAGAHDYLIKCTFGPDLLGRVVRFAVERQKFIEQERQNVVEIWRQTEQAQQLARQLQENRERLDFLLRGTVAIFWDWQIVTDRTTFSGCVMELLGYDCDEWNWGKASWQSLLAPHDRSDVATRLERFFQFPHGDYEDLFRLRAADGTFRPIFARGRVIERSDYGSPVRMIGTFQDVADPAGAHRFDQDASRSRSTRVPAPAPVG